MPWFQMQQWAHDQLSVNLRRSTARRTKNMHEIAFENVNPSRKKARSVKYPLLEKGLIDFIIAKQNIVSLSNDLVIEKALGLRDQLGINPSDLHLSYGWLSRFKERNNIWSRALHGESGSICESTLKTAQSDIKSIMSNYSPDNVFNSDESVLLYRLPPNRTLTTIQQRGQKKVKARVAVALCSNASSTEKMKMLVIGSAKAPRCFKGIDISKKAWLRKFNFLMRGRRVLLSIDNASSHEVLCEHKNVEIVFFPPNMTSKIQPLDAGIIHSFKARYKKLFHRWCLDLVELSTERELTILEAIQFSIDSWGSVDGQVIRNCWVKTGLIDAPTTAKSQSNNSCRTNSTAFQLECAELANLVEALEIYAPIDDYIDVESVEVIYEHPPVENSADSAASGDESSDAEPEVSAAEALKCCIQLHSYPVRQDYDTAKEQDSLMNLMRRIRQHKAQSSKQRSLGHFFKPVGIE